MRRLVVPLAIAFAGCPCGGNLGTLRNARPNSSFVSDPAELIVSTSDGIYRVSLDGSMRTRLFAKFPHRDVPAVNVKDVSRDLTTWVLSDSDTNLWIGTGGTGGSWEVKELHGRLSAAALSPDGKRVAATRHLDFAGGPKEPDDDTIYVIDVATQKVDVISSKTGNWPTRISWSADGKALWLEMAFEQPSQWVTLADRARREVPYGTRAPELLAVDPRPPTWKCREQLVPPDREPEIRIVEDPEKPARVLVRLDGRTRGFHDYQPDFTHAQLTPSCKYVVFQHRNQVWVTDLAGSAAGPVIDGEWLFFPP